MHSACMPTKTISLTVDAYERLRGARRTPAESFSQVVLRAAWPESAMTAAEYLARIESSPLMSEASLRAIATAKAADRPPEDKWTRR